MKHEPESDELNDKLEECINEAAALLAHLRGEHKLVPPMKKPTSEKQFVQHIQPIVERLKMGMGQILEYLTSSATQNLFSINEDTTQQLCQIAAVASVVSDNPQNYIQMIVKDKSLQEIFGLSNETMEKLYQGAKFLYEHQNYIEAAAAFSVLCCISPNNHTFWIGLGNSEYFCHRYNEAVAAYSMAAQADPHDPLCHFFSARCYEALKQKDHAINSLDLALLQIGNQKEFSQWKQRAIEHKQRLSKTA